jgi:Gram-negative bacterial TonB protein C-terminal
MVGNRGVDWPAGACCLAVLAILAGCKAGPRPELPRMPVARTAVQTVEPSRSNSTPAVDDCGLTAYPVSRSTQEILAAVPRGGARPPNSMMLVKVAIDPEGRVTHLRVLRLAHPEASNADAINEQAVDSIKRWHYAPTTVAGKPVAVCSDIAVNIDLGIE